MHHYILVSLFPLLVLAAGAYDIASFRIPNMINILIVLAFFPMAWIIKMDAATLGLHLASGGVIFLITFAMFVVGWIGGGDAKMASAVALWMGFPHLISFVLLTAVAGGVVALILLIWNAIAVLPVFAHLPVAPKMVKFKRIPYGTAIAAGAIFTYQGTEWVSYFLGT